MLAFLRPEQRNPRTCPGDRGARTHGSLRIPPTPASGASSAAPRLRLNPALRHGAVLDGGWWPRSGEPAAELPGLIRALDGRRGPVQRIELGATGWRSRPDLLQAAGRPVRLCWSSEMPSDLLVAVGPGDARTRLLVVPPG
ncbi:DUF5994 family protein [Nocardiopsis composta]